MADAGAPPPKRRPRPAVNRLNIAKKVEEVKPVETEEGWTQSGCYKVENFKIGTQFVAARADPETPLASAVTINSPLSALSAPGSSGRAKPAPGRTTSGANGGAKSRPDILPEDLEEEKVLGKGASGVVLLSRHKDTGKRYAVKIINMAGASDSRMIAEEVKTIDNTCPWMVKAYTAFIREKRLHIVQEFMDKGSLYDILRSYRGGFPEHIVAKVAEQICRGLNHLHGGTKKKKMHRDLKPANILLNRRGDVKISDFGVACTTNTRGQSTFVGTTTYMSPERIKGSRYGIGSDIWSAGLVFCECILGYYPFKNRHTFLQLLMEITKDQNFEFPPETTDACKDFITSCLRQKPEDRPLADALANHPFIQQYAHVTTEDVAAWLSGIEIEEEDPMKAAAGDGADHPGPASLTLAS